MNENACIPRDPRDLDLAARRALCQRMQPQQREWLRRITMLAEATPAPDFPAFLLATGAFPGLAQRITEASTRAKAPLSMLDELERFMDAFADYLRNDRNETVFEQNTRRAG